MVDEMAVGISYDSDRKEELSKKLDIPVISETTSCLWLLGYQQGRLELWGSSKDTGGVVVVDFVEGRSGHRLRSQGSELISKAVGAKKGKRPDIWDVTAGLGRDSFVLASMGCRVQMIERSPVISALLEDGLERLKQSELPISAISERLVLNHENAIHFLEQGESSIEPDVIYMDPMYPERDKSALVKKEMRCLRDIVGDDDDIVELLQKAKQRARSRVVVKRPIRAPLLNDETPSIQYKAKTTRFDIYFPECT